jgi:hypothetical protein
MLVEIPQPRLWTPAAPRMNRGARRRTFERCYVRSLTGLYSEEEPLLAAPSIVQSSIGTEGVFGPSSITASLPGTRAGNAIVVIAIDASVSTNWTTPTDGVNTYVQESFLLASGNSISLATNISGGSVTISQSWTGGGPGWAACYAFELAGVNGFDAASNTAANNGFNPSPVSCPSWVLSKGGDLVITILTTSHGEPGGAIAGYSLYEVTPYGNVIAYTIASAGTQSAITGTWTGGATDTWNFPAAGFTATPPPVIAPFTALP